MVVKLDFEVMGIW